MTKYALFGSALFLAFAAFNSVRRAERQNVSPPPRAPIRSPYKVALAVDGLVEPLDGTISLGAPTSGIVKTVFVTTGDRVKAGEPLFQLDDRVVNAELGWRRSAVDVATAALARVQEEPQPADLASAAARVEEAKSKLRTAEDGLSRAERLQEQNGVAEQQVVERRGEVSLARAQLHQAEARQQKLLVGATPAERTEAKAMLAESRAHMDLASAQLKRLTVTAPCDAVVLQVNIQPGESVPLDLGGPVMRLAPSGRLFVRVEIEEHQIARFKHTEPAMARARGRSELAIPLRFVRVDPIVVPKPARNGPHDKVDARVLQALYEIDTDNSPTVYVGQQLHVYIRCRAESDRDKSERSTDR